MDADRFIFANGAGHDQVMDFTAQDVIVLQNLAGIETLSDALSRPTQIGDDMLFDFGPDDSLLVRDSTVALLAGDILVN